MDTKDLFTNLVLAANVDGELALPERLLLDHYARRCKLNFLEAQKIIDAVRNGERTRLAKPKSPEARRELYRAFVRIVRADKKITSKEQLFLRRVGNLLGIDEALMQQSLSPSGLSE
jgi:hypothetical protein